MIQIGAASFSEDEVAVSEFPDELDMHSIAGNSETPPRLAVHRHFV
jgi:hypothetical protein